jgi:hypothetical protein
MDIYCIRGSNHRRWIASTRVVKFNDWAVSGRCKHQGMGWSPAEVLALAVLEATRCNGELDGWHQNRALPGRALPNRSSRPLDRPTIAPTGERQAFLVGAKGRSVEQQWNDLQGDPGQVSLGED